MNRVIISWAVAVFVLLICAGPAHAQPQRPYIRIVSPRMNECVPGPNVTVQFDAGGMCFSPCGNNLHFMLDDEPFEAQFDPSHPHVFQDVAPGTHTIRAYAANHLHEAIQGTLDVITFSVAYPNEENRPEFGEPLLTYNLPQGEYLGIDAGDITINWMVDGVALSRRGYRVQYYVDGRRFIVYDCNTRHIKGLAPGYHTFKVELVDERGRVAPGPFNSTERVVLVNPDQLAKTYSPADRNPDLPKIPSIHGAMTGGWPTAAVDEVLPVTPRRTITEDLTVRRVQPSVRLDRTDAADAAATGRAAVTDLDAANSDETEIRTTKVRVQEDVTNGEETTDRATTTSIQWQMPGQGANRTMTTVRTAAPQTTATITSSETQGPQASTAKAKVNSAVPAANRPGSSATVLVPIMPAAAPAQNSSAIQTADASKSVAAATIPPPEPAASAAKSEKSGGSKRAQLSRGTDNSTAAAALKMLSLIAKSEKSGKSKGAETLFEPKTSALKKD